MHKMLCLTSGIALAILAGMVSAQYSVVDCPAEDATFELITGWMYSAPTDILETRAGTLQLAECVDACRQNLSCQAVNFETGLCVLFKSQVGEGKEGLLKSQFPVFTMYAQKLCMPSARGCTRAWGFELVRGYALKEDGKKIMQLPSRIACMDACIQEREFPCRSTWWDPEKTECTMSDVDRYGLGILGKFQENETIDYMESQCVVEPNRMCEFRKIENRLLKTVDALYEGIATLDECRQLCLEAPFRCHTFDFEGVCRLSHHGAATVSHIQEPYLQMNGSLSYERGACYNVSLDCRANNMVAVLHTNKVFNGKIYARQKPNSCVEDVTEALNFEISLEYTDPGCGVKSEEAGQFSVDLVLQHHDQIMTSSDLGFALRCSFHLENRSVAHGIELQVNGQIQSMASESAVVPSPNVTMRITDREGGDINTAQVGDPLSLRFEITDIASPYEIFVRELFAMDGANGAEILLIDANGCPTDPSIMGTVGQVNTSGKVLQAFFEAFKFPTTDIVQFQALVTPCLPTCAPVECTLQTDPSTSGVLTAKSFGRRRRRSVVRGNGTATSAHQQEPENLLVVNSIRIADRFRFDENGKRIPMDGSQDVSRSFWGKDDTILTSRSTSGQCLNIFGFIVCCCVLVVVQIAIIFAWMFIWRRKRSSKEQALGVISAAAATPTHYFYAAAAHQQAPTNEHAHFSRKFIHQGPSTYYVIQNVRMDGVLGQKQRDTGLIPSTLSQGHVVG